MDRIYNLAVHTNLPIDLGRTPAVWILAWSRQLESDRIKKNMENNAAIFAANQANAKNRQIQRTMQTIGRRR